MQQIIKISALGFLLLICGFYTKGQFIQEILDYKPAPGQFINLVSTGTPDAAASIAGSDRRMVSLGAAGGYIVFRFSSPIINHPEHPYGVDFTLFGNPLPEWSEPGVVSVMKDENHNGLPDDTWLELAGSDHFFSNTRFLNRVIYKEPKAPATDIAWYDNGGQSSLMVQNSFHTQSYYPGEVFPAEFYRDSCGFQFTLIRGNLIRHSETGSKSLRRAFGYADNTLPGDLSSSLPDNPYTTVIEGYGGDAFDLSWAYSPDFGYADIDTAHFVKVQCSMYGIPGEVGEVSTELTGGRLSTPQAFDFEENRLLILEDIPAELPAGEHRLQAYFFENGRHLPEEEIHWVSTGTGDPVHEDGSVLISRDTDLEIIASARNGDVQSGMLRVRFQDPTGYESFNIFNELNFKIFPNPAMDFITMELSRDTRVTIFDMTGKVLFQSNIRPPGRNLNVSEFSQGLYYISAQNIAGVSVHSFIKR
ncbi:MAG: T9SS type A sorting domain-containing protein [Bacteroidales bacterium]|nr:T9SS type A sorting domain-containing protein [Bacteroidales bacterium]